MSMLSYQAEGVRAFSGAVQSRSAAPSRASVFCKVKLEHNKLFMFKLSLMVCDLLGVCGASSASVLPAGIYLCGSGEPRQIKR